MFHRLKSRLPGLGEILSAYAVIAFMLFTWSFLWFLWNIPSWMNFMTVGTLFATFSYSTAVSFLESLTFLGLLLIVCFILPSSWFRDSFAARGSVLTISLLGLIMLRDYLVISDNFLFRSQTTFGLTVAILSALWLFLAVRFQWMEKALNLLADRLAIFLYIFIPLSAISLLVILVRNLIA